jgi:pimeloyl-ACP methyl ester carboxylesterase
VTEAIGKAMINAYPETDRREAVAFAFFAEGNTVDEDWMRGWYPHAGLAEQAATPSTPYKEWGHAGSAPILVIQPTEDAAAASGGGLLKEAHPERVDLVYAEGAGHALLPERPELVARETLRFLSER